MSASPQGMAAVADAGGAHVAADVPPAASPDAAHTAEVGHIAEPSRVTEPMQVRPTGRMRRTVSWADAQPNKAQDLVAVREFEPSETEDSEDGYSGPRKGCCTVQ